MRRFFCARRRDAETPRGATACFARQWPGSARRDGCWTAWTMRLGALPQARPGARGDNLIFQISECKGEYGRDHHAETLGRVPRHLLAHLWRLRQRGAGGGVSAARHRLHRRRARLRADGADPGLRGRPHFRRALQPGGHGGPGHRRAVPGRERGALRRRAGGGRGGRGGGALPRGLGQARLRDGGLRLQRLRRPQPGQVRPDLRPGD